jgi:hypothetical protein
MAFVLATAAYVLMAWYDVIYDCNDHLRPTLLGWLSAPFKPQEYTDKYKDLPIKYQKVVRWFDIGVLVVIVGLLAYPYIRWSK